MVKYNLFPVSALSRQLLRFESLASLTLDTVIFRLYRVSEPGIKPFLLLSQSGPASEPARWPTIQVNLKTGSIRLVMKDLEIKEAFVDDEREEAA